MNMNGYKIHQRKIKEFVSFVWVMYDVSVV
jgi:hypothetical protein